MSRARTIKPQFTRSRSMRAVSCMARLTFIQLWLAELEGQRCVERYSVDETDYLRFVNWRRHQTGFGRASRGVRERKRKAERRQGVDPCRRNSRATREPRESLGRKSAKPR